MRKVLCLLGVLWAGVSGAAVFERFLDPNVPRDRAILGYLQLEKEGKAKSNDLAELAVLLVEKGFPQDGEAYLRKALKLDKNNVEARYRLGLVFQRLGRHWAAAREYKRVIKARPGFAEAQFMLGLALERSGHRRAAIKAYAKAYKHNPALADAAKNPLVLDSKLQTQAQLVRYRRDVASATLKLQPLDPQAVRQMMLVKPPATPPVPQPAPAPSDKGQSLQLVPPAKPDHETPGAKFSPPPSPAAAPTEEADVAPQRPLLPLGNASRPLRLRR